MPHESPLLNDLLAALPADEWQRLSAHAEIIPLVLGEVLQPADDRTSRVYFPTSGVISALTVTEEGGSVEAMLAGAEGAMGIGAAIGFPTSPWRLVVQAGGSAIAITPTALAEALTTSATLARLCLKYSHAMQQLASQSIACNRFHTLPERMARWLLMMLDRVEGNELRLTQDFLAQMLGAYRPSATQALAVLERAGLVSRAGRGRIVVLNRKGLEDASCECYERVRLGIRQVTG